MSESSHQLPPGSLLTTSFLCSYYFLSEEKVEASTAKIGAGAIAGIVIGVILLVLIAIDMFCCFFNNCGVLFCCRQALCGGGGAGGGAAKDDCKSEAIALVLLTISLLTVLGLKIGTTKDTKILGDKQKKMKLLLNSFLLNGHILGLYP